jgi:hypothetical protein
MVQKEGMMKKTMRIAFVLLFSLSLLSCSSGRTSPVSQANPDALTATALNETATPQPSDTPLPSPTKKATRRATVTRRPTKSPTLTPTLTGTATETATETGTITLTPTESETPPPVVRFLLPARSTTKYHYTESWGRGDETLGKCKSTENLYSEGSETDLTVKYWVTYSNSGLSCFFLFYSYEVDRVTGALISTGQDSIMLKAYAGPMPGTTTMTVLGQELSIYLKDVQTTIRKVVKDQGYWEWEWNDTVYYDAATGIMVGQHGEGKAYYTGTTPDGTRVERHDYEDWGVRDWEMTENTIPLGKGTQ